MTHTRWKLLAGCFGIAMCGLAALAGASRQSPLALGCDYRPPLSDEPRHVAQIIPVQPVFLKHDEKKIVEAASKPPVLLVPTLPAANLEPIPRAEPLKLAKELPGITLPITPSVTAPPAIAVSLPSPASSSELPPIPGIAVNQNTTAAPKLVSPEPIQLPTPRATTTPVIPPLNAADIPKLTIVPEPAIMLPGVGPVGTPQAPTAPSIPTVTLPGLVEPSASKSTPDVSQVVPQSALTIPSIEKKPQAPTPPVTPEVTLTIRMTGSTPTIDLRSSSGAYLSITCDQLDIAARGPKDELPSSIKASGKVKFSASGCQGTCDELVFNPKTMEGTLKNAVKVRSAWNDSTTELTADQMAFQLLSGSQPFSFQTSAVRSR